MPLEELEFYMLLIKPSQIITIHPAQVSHAFPPLSLPMQVNKGLSDEPKPLQRELSPLHKSEGCSRQLPPA